MSNTELNLNQYVYKKLKFFKDQPELYLEVCKASMNRLGKSDHIPPDDWFIERLNDPNYQFLSADNIIREATGFADREIFKSELIELDGWCMPPIDHITGLARYMNTKLSGILIPFLTTDGKLYLLTKWKQGGQSEVFLPIAADYQVRQIDQRRIPVPVFYRCRIQIQKKINLSRKDPNIKYTEYRFQYLMSVDINQVISEEKLQKALASISLLPSEVKPEHRTQVIVLRGITWKTVNPAELWVKSEKRVKIIPQDPTKIKKDAKGNPVYDYKEADPEKHKLGQELFQMKHGTDEKPVNVFTFQLFVNSERSENLVSCNVWNNQFGNPLIWIPSFYDIGKNIVSNFGVVKKEDSQDPYNNLDQHLRGTELLILGRVSNLYRPNEKDPYQITINAMFIADVRFPFLESEDRPLPILINTYVKDLPIVETIGKPEDLEIGKIPEDLDLSLGMSYEELDKISKQFTKVPEAKTTEMPEEPKVEAGVNMTEYPHSDAFGEWLVRLANDFKENNYIEESKFAITYSDKLIDLLEESDNIWRPGNPTHLVLANEESIAPDSDLYEYFVEHYIEGGEPKSELQTPEKTPTEPKYPPAFMKFWDELVDTLPADIDKFENKEIMNYMVKQKVAEIIPTDDGLQLRFVKKPGSEIVPVVMAYWMTKLKPAKEVLIEAVTESLKKEVEKVAEVIKEETVEIIQSESLGIQEGFEDNQFSPEENIFYNEFTGVLFGLFDKNTAESFKREYSPALLDRLHQLKLVEVVGSHQDIVKWIVVPEKQQENTKLNLKNWVVGFKIMGLKKLFPNYDSKNKTIQGITIPKEDKDFLEKYKTDTEDITWNINGLDRKTRPTLHKIAKTMGIRGYTKGMKEDLVAKMLEAHGEPISKEPITTKDETQDELDTLVEQLAASEKEITPTITTGLTKEQDRDMTDLKGSIKDYLKSGLVTDVTFSEIFHNLPGFLPTWVNETHEQLIDKIIKTVKKEIANNSVEA